MFGSKWGFRRRKSKNPEEDCIPLREKSVSSTNNQLSPANRNTDHVLLPVEPDKGLNMSFSSISSTLSKAATNIDISFAPPLSRNNSDSGSEDDASAPVYLTMEETLSLGVLDHLDRPIAVLDNDSDGSADQDSHLLFENGSESTDSLVSKLASVKSGYIPDRVDQNKENNPTFQSTSSDFNRPLLSKGFSGHVDESHDDSYSHEVLYPPASPESEGGMSDSGYQCSEVGSSYYDSEDENNIAQSLQRPGVDDDEDSQPSSGNHSQPRKTEDDEQSQSTSPGPTTPQKNLMPRDSTAESQSGSSDQKAPDATQQFWLNCLEENGVDLAGSPVFSKTTSNTDVGKVNDENPSTANSTLSDQLDMNGCQANSVGDSNSFLPKRLEVQDADESLIPPESLQYSTETARTPPRKPFDINDLMAKPEEMESRLIYSPSLCDNSAVSVEPQPVQSPRLATEMNLLSLSRTMSVSEEDGRDLGENTFLVPSVSRVASIDDEYHTLSDSHTLPDNPPSDYGSNSPTSAQKRKRDHDTSACESHAANGDNTSLSRDFYNSERHTISRNSDQKKDGTRERGSGNGGERSNNGNNDLPGGAGDDNRDDEDDKKQRSHQKGPETDVSSSEESSDSREEGSPDGILKSFGEAKHGLHFDIVKSFDESELSPKSKKKSSSNFQHDSSDQIFRSFGEAKHGLHFDIVKSFDESEVSPKSKKRASTSHGQSESFRFDSPQRLSTSISETKDAVRFDINELSPRRQGRAESMSPWRGESTKASGLLEPPLVQRAIKDKTPIAIANAEEGANNGMSSVIIEPQRTGHVPQISREPIRSWEGKDEPTVSVESAASNSIWSTRAEVPNQFARISSKVSTEESKACDPETDALYSARKDDTSVTTTSVSLVTTASAFAARLENDPNKWVYEVWASKGLLNDEKWQVLNVSPAVVHPGQKQEESLTLTLPDKDRDSSIDEEAERETSPLMSNCDPSSADNRFEDKDAFPRKAGVSRKSLPPEKHTGDLKKNGPRRKTFSNIMQMWREKDDVAPALMSPGKTEKVFDHVAQQRDGPKKDDNCKISTENQLQDPQTASQKAQWSPRETLGIQGRQSPEDWTERAHKDIQRFQPELVLPKKSSSPVSQTAIMTGRQADSIIGSSGSLSNGGDSFDTQQVNSIFREKVEDSQEASAQPQQKALTGNPNMSANTQTSSIAAMKSSKLQGTPSKSDKLRHKALASPSKAEPEAGFMVTPPSRRFNSPPQRFLSAGRQRPTSVDVNRPKSAPRARILDSQSPTSHGGVKTDKYGFSIDNQLQNPSGRSSSTSKKKRSSAVIRERHVERTNRKPGTFNLAAPRSSKTGADYKSVVRTFLCTRGPGEESQNSNYALVAKNAPQTPSERAISQTPPNKSSSKSPMYTPSDKMNTMMPRAAPSSTPKTLEKSMNTGVDTPQSQWIQLYEGGNSASRDSPRGSLQLAISGISYDAGDSVFSEDDEYGKNDECACVSSVFSGNRDLAEFFLPRMSQACTCGKSIPELVDPDEPTSLKNILKPWQCRFLAGFGISRGDQLVKAHHRSAQALATSLRKYRQRHQMVPFKTKSCGVALQIWSKTSKAYVRSIRKQLIHGTDRLRPPNTMDVLTSFLDKMQDAEAAGPSDPPTPALIRHEDDIRAQEEEI